MTARRKQAKKMERRILAIWLPALAIERWAKLSGAEPDAAIVLTVEGTHGPVIHAATPAAAARGARAGARLTDARALDPGLLAVPADVAGDAELVERLARWAQRWSPLVEVDGADALRLEVSGTAHLFGGEAGLIADVGERFAALGLTARAAIAPTAAAAWAMARHGRAGASVGAAGLGEQLAPLPVAALRLSPQATRTLERLGLKTISALAGIERRSLARRFRDADNPVDALDRMLGRKDEPLTAAPFALPPRALLRLEEPAVHAEAGAQALERLIPRLVAELQARQLGARRLSLSGYRVDGSVAVASVATAIPSREGKHLHRLLADKTAALDPGFGFDAFALEASWSEPLGAAQDSLVEEVNGEADVARLVDRLSVKLGAEKVCRPMARESHMPERASGWVAAIADRPTPNPSCSREEPKGPQRLLDRPEAIAVVYATPEGLPRRFMWRRAVHDIARVEGPERIAPEWWREPSSARLRDYYRVEDQAGRRYWIFREGVIGDGRGGAPGWFIHGLFG
jgi:protein ImuB